MTGAQALIKRIFLTSAAALLLLAAVMIGRAFMLPGSAASPQTPRAFGSAAQNGAVAARLAEAIRFATISHGDGRAPEAAAFEGFAAFLTQRYPAAHSAMTREQVGHSLLYRWPGTGADAPVAFLAHLDVVPVEPGTQDQWTYPPFEGVVADGFVWGRGAMDDKGHLIALMEAAEQLAASGFRPSRDIYFLFGHDEEIGGPEGATAMRRLLDERGVRFEWTLDEGSGLVAGIIPRIDSPIALIAVAEKGSITLKFTATAPGGHSSAPGKDTAVSLVARAVVAVNDHPYPLVIDSGMAAFLKAVAPQLSFGERVLLANLWLTGPIVAQSLGKSPTTAAALRTTTAPTIIDGGVKANILPQTASAVVNYRIHPRDSVASVMARATALIGDPRVSVESQGGAEPSPVSSSTSDGYRAMAETTAEIFGPLPIAPFLTLQGTDTRHYVGAADGHYRFTPFIYEPDDLRRIHGTDERVRIGDIVRGAAWYEALIRRVAG
ncbi:MAG: M20/M25/M40 family metallo-hydrolase [Parvularculaceae bacterium]|nr:M20/M25/M40 family metallo-hydrolase [Parvularculaceae bacterium]